jgi:hypothetical protein
MVVICLSFYLYVKVIISPLFLEENSKAHHANESL